MSSDPQHGEAIEVFYSYSHKDKRLLEKLIEHLAGLERQGIITAWHDREIGAGREWKDEIDEHLETASVILLLISPSFMKSDYCNDVEAKRAMQRHDAGEARVIPVLLRPVDWEGTPFSKLQALPTDAKPVTQWRDKDTAFLSVAKAIREAVRELSAKAGDKLTSSSIPRPPVIGFVARRDAEGRDIVERLQADLAPQQNQLITLSGPGGIGKTTLAAEAARALKEIFKGRLVWSSADGRTDFTLSTLLDDISTQLGHEELRPLASDAKAAQVHALVAETPTLVVLDNYETISDDAKKGIEEWLTHAQCSALITSRHRIISTRNIPIVAMSPEEAQEFLEKLVTETQDAQIFSTDIRQRVYKTAEANPFVMQWIVGQIDQAQEPDTVLEELQHGEGDAAQRVFDRSFNLEILGDDGRAALLALSLFSPSASRDALAEVAGFGKDSKRINEAVKNLRALWLIKGIAENSRFTIEGLTRSLARARLSKDKHAAEFRQRFVVYFLSYAGAHSQTSGEDFDALEAEKDNVLGALDVAYEMKDWQSVMGMRSALEEFLDLRGYWDEAIRRGEQALQAARYASTDRGVAHFAHNVAAIHYRRGELGEARRLYDESLEIAKSLGNQSGIASTLHQLAVIAQAQGELGEARRLYDESLEIKKSLGNQSGIAITLHAVANVLRSQGELAEARRLYEESLAITEKLGDKSNLALIFYNLGLLEEEEGNTTEAKRLWREALSMFEQLGSPYAEMVRRALERLEGEDS